MNKNIHKRNVISRLQVFGLSKEQSVQVAQLTNKWVTANGLEWTVSRLKQLKVAYIHKIAGYETPFQVAPWVSHKSGYPKGPFGAIFRLKNPQKALGALMSYSDYMHDNASPSQIKKFTEAVSGADLSSQIQITLSEQFNKAVHSLGSLPRGKFQNLSRWSERNVRVPDISYRESSPYDPVVVGTTMDLEVIKRTCSHPIALTFLEKCVDDLPDTYYRMYSSSCLNPEDFDGLEGTVGKIGFIQEPGLKLRTVANPFPIFQVLLSRLGSSLYSLLTGIEEDSTFDQDKSVLQVQDQLKNGRKLMSIDLSSATDRFPLHFTMSVLRTLGCDENDLSLFEDVSRSNWILPGGKTIKWETGQPLGVFPSFAAFALSHHALVRMVSPDFYRILGDDMIIDYEAGMRLRQLYKSLDLPISEDKSLVSDILGEFGGRLITSNYILTQPKWRAISDRSFIDLLRGLGPKGVNLLQPRQRKMARLLAEIPEEVCPYGLGWNPEGKSFNTRVTENQETINLLSTLELQNIESGDAKRSYMLGQKIVLDYGSDFHLPLKSTTDSETQIGSLEERMFQTFGITNIDVLDRILPGWTMSSVPDVSDPRGYSTLQHLERMLLV